MSQSNGVRQAAALKYAMERENSAPVVIASGLGTVAQKIVDVAMEHNVPIYEDDSLAALLTQLEVGSQIPEELYQAIVEIYVYFLNFTIPAESIENAKNSEENSEEFEEYHTNAQS
jgi:flagellar biosynthesis protein